MGEAGTKYLNKIISDAWKEEVMEVEEGFGERGQE